MKYDIDYFINKFENIPDDKWTTGKFVDGQGAKCALGHCGRNNDEAYTKESYFLSMLLAPLPVSYINDAQTVYDQPTPKTRILAALRGKKERKI